MWVYIYIYMPLTGEESMLHVTLKRGVDSVLHKMVNCEERKVEVSLERLGSRWCVIYIFCEQQLPGPCLQTRPSLTLLLPCW